MKLPLNHSLKLIEKAREQEMKEKLYRLWLARYPLYTDENYETFDEFCWKVNPAKVDRRSDNEILNEIYGEEKAH